MNDPLRKLCDEANLVAQRLAGLRQTSTPVEQAPDLFHLAEKARQVAAALTGAAQMQEYGLYIYHSTQDN